jgi:Zn-dependent peptidase ImmA (M78 family)
MSNLGLVIATARRADGATQEQLAEKVGVSQVAMCRYELGTREPEPEILERLARALNVTTDFLLDSSKIRGAIAVEAHMRRRKTAKPSEWKRLEARLNMQRMHARRVFDQISVYAEHRIPSFDPVDTDPASAARMARMQWRMPSGPIRALTQWIEAAGCVVIEEDFGTGGVDGLSHWIDEIPIIMLNAAPPTDRKRLTMAHELGHLCLHSLDVTETMEEEASAFGAEFLAPSEAIRPELRNLTLGKLVDLKREWGISVQALIERAWQLKMIDSAERTRFYKALSARGWRKSEPSSEDLALERPELTSKIGENLFSHGLSHEEIAALAGFWCPDPMNPYLPRRKLRAL